MRADTSRELASRVETGFSFQESCLNWGGRWARVWTTVRFVEERAVAKWPAVHCAGHCQFYWRVMTCMQDTFARAAARPSARATIGYLVYKVMTPDPPWLRACLSHISCLPAFRRYTEAAIKCGKISQIVRCRGSSAANICGKSAVNICEMCGKSAVNICKMCGKSTANICEMCGKSAVNICDMCGKSAVNICEMCGKSAANICEMYGKSAANICEMCGKSAVNFFQLCRFCVL